LIVMSYILLSSVNFQLHPNKNSPFFQIKKAQATA